MEAGETCEYDDIHIRVVSIRNFEHFALRSVSSPIYNIQHLILIVSDVCEIKNKQLIYTK